MSEFNTPPTFTNNSVLTAEDMNNYVRDNLRFLTGPPACLLHSTTGKTVSNNTWTDYDAFNYSGCEVWDSRQMHNSNTNPERITITEPGIYLVFAMVRWNANSTNVRQFRLVDDAGTTVQLGSEKPDAAFETIATYTYLWRFASAGWIKAQVYQNSGSSLICNTCAFGVAWQAAP